MGLICLAVDPENGSNKVDENGTLVLPYQDPPPANVNYSVNLGYACALLMPLVGKSIANDRLTA